MFINLWLLLVCLSHLERRMVLLSWEVDAEKKVANEKDESSSSLWYISNCERASESNFIFHKTISCLSSWENYLESLLYPSPSLTNAIEKNKRCSVRVKSSFPWKRFHVELLTFTFLRCFEVRFLSRRICFCLTKDSRDRWRLKWWSRRKEVQMTIKLQMKADCKWSFRIVGKWVGE